MVGYVIDLGAADGSVRVTLDLAPCHLNRVGSLHGGIVAMLLDAAAGFAVSRGWSEAGNALLVTVSLTTDYIASVNHGRVIAVGRITGGGQSVKFAQAELRGEEGQLLATASGAFKRVRKRRGP